jgi:phage terminase small subunit
MPSQVIRDGGDAEKPLTAKQQRFVEEYLIDLNAHRAAQRAGYRAKSSSCVNILRLANVQAAVSRALDAKRQQTGVSAERVIEELSRMAFANVWDYLRPGVGDNVEVDVAALLRDDGAGIVRARLEYFPATDGACPTLRRVSVSLGDKLAALRTLASCLGMDPSVSGARSGFRGARRPGPGKAG